MKQKHLQVPHHFIYNIITLLRVVAENTEIIEALINKMAKENLSQETNSDITEKNIKAEVEQLVVLYNGIINKMDFDDITRDGFSIIFSNLNSVENKDSFGDIDFGDFDINLN